MNLFRIVLCVFCISLMGCPHEGESTGPVDTCSKAGEQCKMGGGQLGVCMNDMQKDPPQLFCMSQH